MEILINSLHPNNAIQLTHCINQCIQFDYDPVLHTTLTLYTINTVSKTTTLSSSFLLYYKVVQGHLVSLKQVTLLNAFPLLIYASTLSIEYYDR